MLGLPLRGRPFHMPVSDEQTLALVGQMPARPDLVLVLPELPHGAGSEGTASRGEMEAVGRGVAMVGKGIRRQERRALIMPFKFFDLFKIETGEPPQVPLPVLDLKAETTFRRLFRVTHLPCESKQR